MTIEGAPKLQAYNYPARTCGGDSRPPTGISTDRLNYIVLANSALTEKTMKYVCTLFIMHQIIPESALQIDS